MPLFSGVERSRHRLHVKERHMIRSVVIVVDKGEGEAASSSWLMGEGERK